MSKKIIIKESQLKMLKTYISENSNHSKDVKELVDFLRAGYESTIGTYKKGGEYHDKPMVLNRTNNQMMTIASLYEYLKHRFGQHNDDFIKRVVSDWYGGKVTKENTLSKNVKNRR